ncbi:uncharacterized protein LY89DRAFT_664467 [Mollisia scopiformis]|uniref:Uncharacterized protein n=1 Tax=Mollisia scopiformis TaxID=149040 RepID=A0A194XQW1_MOLSC|nr:uncharacterized protein LY89DRAFT_664467 [Mollisia scopiformis]KUJ22670.1 hypothetical protein LY89DRAFT_664467 [Mollisia scopiformis]
MPPQGKKTLRESALETNKNNPSQLGDPISLKSETADSSPTNQDRGASSSSQSSSSVKENLKSTAPAPTEGDTDGKGKGGHQTLRQKAMQKLEENPSQLGDPVSLKAETADSRPTDQDKGAAGKGGKSKL